MKKTIVLKENTFNKLKKIIIKEALQTAPIFGSVKTGNYIDYNPILKGLEKIQNLHSDRYKDYQLEEAFNEWKNSGFRRDTEEYFIYKSKFSDFMNKFIRNVSYTLDRFVGQMTGEDTGNSKKIEFHTMLLDRKWVDSLNGKPNWKYSDLNSGYNGDEWQCFYSTLLKLYQNPVIWNDFFFNPIFEPYRKSFDYLMNELATRQLKKYEKYEKEVKPLLPAKEFAQIKNFINGIRVTAGKIEKGVNNAKPELFIDFDPSNQDTEQSFDNEDY